MKGGECGSTARGGGCPDSRAEKGGVPRISKTRSRRVDALAAVDLVGEVVLEADDGELLNVVVGDVIVELGRQHRGDVVGAIREHDAVPLLLLRIGLLFVVERAEICAAGRGGDDRDEWIWAKRFALAFALARGSRSGEDSRPRVSARRARRGGPSATFFGRLAPACRDAPAIWRTEFNPWSPWCRRSECPVESSYPAMIVRSRRSFLEEGCFRCRAPPRVPRRGRSGSVRRQPAFEKEAARRADATRSV